MNIQLLRHATLLLEFGGITLLVDPMLSDKESMPPIVNSSNDRRNPLVDLVAPADYLQKLNAILLTHTHRDHFDDAAAEKLPKNIPILCQPADKVKLMDLGFEIVIPVEKETLWQGIEISRTEGQHGTEEIGKMMAPVSGYVLKSANEPALYIAGDTIYCPEVEQALKQYHPDIVVINGGGAKFNVGDPITMTTADAEKVLRFAPAAKLIVIHLNAINHCEITREDFYKFFTERQLLQRVFIPADGEVISL